MGVLVLGFLVGLDNLAVASGLGLLGLGRSRRLWFAASCSCFEALAPLIGLSVGLELRVWIGSAAEWVGPACLASCSLLVLNALARRREVPSLLDRPLAMVLVPLMLSLDNLTAGVGLGISGAHVLLEAAAIGVISGVMSAAGFAIGGHLRTRSARLAGVFAGASLFACAAFSLFGDFT